MSTEPLNLKDVNHRERRCRRCGCMADFVEPEHVAERAELNRVLCTCGPMAFMQRCREITGCELRNAKAVSLHMTKTQGKCHWCNSPIPVVTYSDCPKCGAFNIWWGETE